MINDIKKKKFLILLFIFKHFLNLQMKGESLHTLQTKKRLFEFKEQFF